jgi:predicted metal-dependent phosphoesterase TrpH
MRSQNAIDLHTHTLVSDGADTPLELVEAAAKAGIEVLAVTDHDTVDGVRPAREAARGLGVEVLAGCEITGEVGGRVIHLLAYGEGLLRAGAIDRVIAVRLDRAERNQRIGQELEELTGVGYGAAVELAGGAALSRAHFARALVRAGIVADVAEAFDRYLSNGRPAYVPAPSMAIDEVVKLVHLVGGVVVLAHPGRLAPAERERVVDRAIAAGIDGLEVWHSQHDLQAQRHWLAKAERHGLLATGGSDYHGRHKPNVSLATGGDGRVEVPVSALDDLTRRLTATAELTAS